MMRCDDIVTISATSVKALVNSPVRSTAPDLSCIITATSCQRSSRSKRNGFSEEFMNLEASENKIDVAPDRVKCARILA